MIGNGWRINPALWSYFHYDTESLAQELWEICGWEDLTPPTSGNVGFISPIFALRFMGV